MGLEVVVNQITMLGITMLIGFAAVKLKYLDGALRDSISKLIVRITLPCLIVTSLTKNDLSGPLLKNAGIVAVCAFCAISVLYAVNFLLGKAFRLSGPNLRLHALSGAFGNIGFLGYPLIGALFGETGLFYAVIYGFVNDFLVWTFGVLQLRGGSGEKGGAKWRNLINPGTISFFVASALLLLRIKLPPLLFDALSGIGSLTTYLSMLFIGMLLAGTDLRAIYKRFAIYALALVKMIVVPILLMLLLKRLGIEQMVASVIVLQVAMPSLTVITIIANEYHADSRYAAEAVFITTILSLITLPFIYSLLARL